MRKKNIFFLLPFLTFILAATSLPTVRVGIYHNPPLSFVEDDRSGGFFVEVLDRIAEAEGWQLEYYLCEWEACLQALEKGEIDLLSAIAYSEERSKRFDFSAETMLTNWGQVYVQSGETNISILDLEDKPIAMLEGDIHADAFLSIIKKFAVELEPVYFSNYDDMLVAIEEKQVYGAVLNHIYAMQYTPAYAVEETGIIFNPIEVRFAAPKGENAELLAKLDAQIIAMKADDDSIYHQAMVSWLQPEINQSAGVESWVLWSIGGVLLVAILLVGINYILRAEVRNRTEDARRSREELALIIDRIPEMIAFVDAEQRYLYVDEDYASWYGFKKEDVVGKYVEEVLSPENYAKVRPNLIKLLKTGEELHYSHQVVRRDGKKANLAISYIPKKDKSGNVEAFFATLRDITQEKQAEIALAESEAKYRQLVDNALIGIFIVQDERIRFLNQGVLTLFGYDSFNDMLNRPVSDFIGPQDAERMKDELNSVILDTGSGAQYIFRALRKDGSVFDAEIVCQLIQYNGEAAVQVMLIDVSDQMRAEARFRHLSEASYEAIFISERGVCLEQNGAAERMFGYSQEEAIGRMGNEWIVREDRELVMHHMLAGYEEPYRVTALRKDGTTFPVEIVGRMMEYEGRKVRVTALRDISAQLKAEENLRESEERYRSIIQKNHAVMLLIDPSTGGIVDANAAASEFYGWTQEELQKKRISEINTLSSDKVDAEMRKAKTAKRNHFFFKHRLANDEIRDVEIYSTPMSVYGRDLLHSIVHDISDRVKAEKELLESKERFETIIAKMPIPIGVVNLEGEPDNYNECFTEVFGYKSDEVVNWWETIYPDSEYRAMVKKDWNEAVKRARESGSQFETRVWEIVRKDGQKRTVEFDIVLLDDFSIVIMNDITEQLQANHELKDRERKLREAQEIGKIGHWELDLHSNELIWSEQVCRIFNLDPQNLTTSYEVFLNVIHPEDRDYVNESYTRSLESKIPYDITHRVLLDGGEVRYVQERCKTEYDQQGNPLRSFGTTQDITEKVHVEQVMSLRAKLAEYSLTHSLGELLRKTLDEAEELTNSKIGFYHFVDAEQNNVSLQQWSSRTVDDYCEVPDLDRHYPIDKAGIWVECIKTKAPMIHNDYGTVENAKGLPEGHATLSRELTVPVIRGDKVLAILGVGNKPTEYTQQDVEIVSKIADLCWEIAESKLIEEALSESESLLHATQKLAGLGSYRFYIYSEEWTSNSVLDEIFGIDENYKRSTEGWLGLIHPEDRPMMQTYLFENVLGKETPFDKRYRIVQQNTQEIRWVHGLGKLEYDSEGHLVSMVGTIQDITARALVEKELETSEERLRTLINATPDIICFKNGQGRWLTANDAQLKLLELTNVDYVGKKDSELAEHSDFHRKTFLAFEDTDEIAWLAGGLSRANQVVPTADDGDKVYDVIKVPLFKEDGTREALVILGRDITQQVAFQNELKHHARQLEIVNAISTALTTSLALDELLKTILQQVVQVVNCDSASIFLVEDDDKLRLVNAVGAAEVFINRTVELSESLMKKIALDQKIHVSDDLLDDPDFMIWDGSLSPIRAWMGLPLYARGNLIGYLTFDNAQPRSFTASDASLAIAFGTQVAQALSNAQLYERVIADANDLEKHVQKRTEELQSFVDLTAGREVRMIELKSIIRELRRQLVFAGQVPVVGDEFDIE